MLKPGDRIAEWDIIQPLGEGGMGAVYLVRNFRVKETVLALKVLLPRVMSDPQIRARFLREGEVMSEFEHKHIVRVFSDGVRHDPRHNLDYILMEYIRGKTLHTLLKEKAAQGQQLDLAQVLEFASHIAQALMYAHTQNPPIIHRDIKPGNIMIAEPILEPPDNYYPLGRAVVMDWGIAKRLDGDDTQVQLASLWAMVGTPRYCAPEQMRPPGLVGFSADVYSLGMVVYEMYAGQPFFANLHSEHVIYKVLNEPQENEPHFDRPADPAFVELVRKAIAKSHILRYRRVEEFLQALEAYRRSLPDSTPPTQILARDEEDNEQRRRKSEEQQRSLTLQLQAQARSAQEKALQAGAEEWAVPLFQQGVARTEEADRKLDDRHYFPAQEAYDEAKRLFDRARGDALAFSAQKVEQARRAMLTAKAAAEHFGARERAKRFFAAGLASEDQAQGFAEITQYRQAADAYEKAKGAFEDAHDRAYDAFQADIDAERTRMLAAKEAAQGEDAERFAVELFQDAHRSEQQAVAALEREELPEAFTLYHAALQKYAQAQKQARLEQQRQHASLLRQRVEAARAKADDRQTAQDAQAAYQQASTAHREGDAQFAAQEYEQAARSYEHAQQAYDQAAREAEELQSNQALRARQRLAEVRSAAQQCEIDRRLPLENAQARRLAEQGEEYEKQGAFAQAVTYYRQAAEQFAELEKTATVQREQERQESLKAWQRAKDAQQAAEKAGVQQEAAALYEKGGAILKEVERLLQTERFPEATYTAGQASTLFSQAIEIVLQEQAKRATEAAQVRMEQAGTAAEEVGARTYFAERFADAQACAEQGQQYAARGQFDRAMEWYEQTEQQFAQLEHDAIMQAAREQAATAQRQMEERKKEAAALSASLGPKWTEAQHSEAAADRALQAQEYKQATRLYREAEEKYSAARAEAEEEHDRQRVLAIRQAAEQARRAAELVEATAYAPALFTQANAAQQQGAERLAARLWDAAAEEFLRAQDLFLQARQAAEREQERQRAERERQEAERARVRRGAEHAQQQAATARAAAEEAGAHRYAAQLLRQGVAAQEAEQSVVVEDFPQATQHYQQAKELFQTAAAESQKAAQEAAEHQAVQAAERDRRQQEAELAKQQALAARTEAERHEAERYAAEQFAAGEAARQRAEQQFHQERFPEATNSYQHARVQFAQAVQEARGRRARQEATVVRVHATTAQATAQALGAAERFTQEFAQARQLIEEGQQKEAEEQFAQAVDAYERATRQFSLLCQQVETQRRAEEEHSRQRALEAHRQAEQSRTAADEVQAQQYAQTQYQRAAEARRQGEQNLAGKRWEEAAARLLEAAALFADATREAQHSRARHGAEVAQGKALEVRQEARAAKGEALCPGAFAEAESLLREAEQTFAREAFGTAQALFDKSAVLFRQVQRDAVTRAQKEQAERARARAVALAQRAQTVSTRKKRRAEKVLAAGDQLFAKQRYGEALRKYDEAASLFAKLPVPQPALEKPVRRVKNPFVLYGGSLAMLVVVVGVVVGVVRNRPSEQTPPAPQKSGETPPPGPPIQEPPGEPLRITKVNPDTTREQPVKEGQALTFAVEAAGGTQRSLRYQWFLDGAQQSEGRQWTYQPDFDAASEKAKEIKVTVSDGETTSEPTIWRVRVLEVNRAPLVVSKLPKPDVIEITVGEEQTFTIRADDPDKDDRIAYVWSLDGQEVARAESGNWQLPTALTEGAHRVLVEVIDKGGLKAQAAWKIAAKVVVAALPPRITRADPEPKGELIVAEGEQQPFVVEAESPQQKPLRYAWWLDSRRKAEGKQWTYQPDFDEGGEKTKEVKVIVTDGVTSPVVSTWQVRVQDVNRPPKIVRIVPKEEPVAVTVGKTQEFTIRAADPDKDDQIAYVWSLDGREVAREKSGRWQLPTALTEGPHQVTVEAIDKGGLKTQVAWNIAAKGPPVKVPPRVVAFEPQSERVVLQEGEGRDFRLRVSLPGDLDDDNKLTYQWNIDDGSPQSTNAGLFRFPGGKPGSYQLTAIALSPDGLQSAPQKWLIEVKARAIEPSKPPAKLGLSREEVERWIEDMKQAYAKKDAAQLVRLGAIKQKNQQEFEKMFAEEQSHVVRLQNVSIDIQENRAEVRYERSDIINNKSTPSVKNSLILEKGGDGQITGQW